MTKSPEELDRISRRRVPFMTFAAETLREEQSNGQVEKVELFVIKIDKEALKIYSIVAAALILTLLSYSLYGAWS